MNELLIRSLGPAPALALMEDRRLVEYHALTEDLSLQAGAIYLGRAGRVMKNLRALFVRLTGGVEGFLPFDELLGKEVPRPGDSLLVQVKKPPAGGKAAYLTCDLAFPGRYAMLLPFGSGAHASKRVNNRQAMRALARRLCPEGRGLVLRASAEEAGRAEVSAEIAGQLAAFERVLALAEKAQAPALLQSAPSVTQRLLRDLRQLPGRVVTDSEKEARGLGLPVLTQEDPFSLYGVETQLQRALGRRVYLPSGGFLVLDPCEAALLIDVNTGHDAGRAGDPILRTNLEAAAEIARLLRLRRAGGIILIDFIDMQQESQRDLVRQRLEEALKEDRVISEVLGFTRLGLLEMTRRRAESALDAENHQNGGEPEEDRETDDA